MKGMDGDSAAAAWIGLFLLINTYWIGYDLWANRTGHYSMTHEMQDWLAGRISGPLIFGLLVAIPAIFLYHIFVKATP